MIRALHLAFVVVVLAIAGCATPSGEELTVFTWNVRFAAQGADDVVARLQAEEADIVLLQEVSPKWEKILRRRLKRTYPYMRFHARKGAYGYATLGRVPLGEAKLLRGETRWPFAQCFTVERPTRAVICNVHLKSPRGAFVKGAPTKKEWDRYLGIRRRQFQKLTRHVEKRAKGRPQILAGDFNTLPLEPLHDVFTRRFQDAADEAHIWPDATYPADDWPGRTVAAGLPAFPVFRLDYVFVSEGVVVEELEVLDVTGSDHLPVRAKLRVSE